MQFITIDQLRNNLERYVRESHQGDIEIREQDKAMAVLTAPRPSAVSDRFWEERERVLSTIHLGADWNSTAAVSSDRDRQ
jgi:hypothetical protein